MPKIFQPKSQNRRSNRASSTVEYLVLFAAAISFFLVFLQRGGVFHQAVDVSASFGAFSLEEQGRRIHLVGDTGPVAGTSFAKWYPGPPTPSNPNPGGTGDCGGRGGGDPTNPNPQPPGGHGSGSGCGGSPPPSN